MVLDADLTYTPSSVSLASTALLLTPSSLASALTRASPDIHSPEVGVAGINYTVVTVLSRISCIRYFPQLRRAALVGGIGGRWWSEDASWALNSFRARRP